MAILTHGSDLQLAPALRPLVRPAQGGVRLAIERIAAAGFSRVQLDAALPGIRPRELDKRARKDLLALVGRHGMTVAGLDLFIPRKDFLTADRVDRATSAVLGAIEFAADLGRIPLHLPLPAKALAEDLKATFIDAADGRGIALAVHAEDQLDDLAAWVDDVDLPCLGMSVDPAALLAAGLNPVDLVHQHAKRLTGARLSDVSIGDSTTRCAIGEGELDVVAYRVALDLATRRHGGVVLDLRNVEQPLRAAAAARDTWDDAAFTV